MAPCYFFWEKKKSWIRIITIFLRPLHCIKDKKGINISGRWVTMRNGFKNKEKEKPFPLFFGYLNSSSNTQVYSVYLFLPWRQQTKFGYRGIILKTATANLVLPWLCNCLSRAEKWYLCARRDSRRRWNWSADVCRWAVSNSKKVIDIYSNLDWVSYINQVRPFLFLQLPIQKCSSGSGQRKKVLCKQFASGSRQRDSPSKSNKHFL